MTWRSARPARSSQTPPTQAQGSVSGRSTPSVVRRTDSYFVPFVSRLSHLPLYFRPLTPCHALLLAVLSLPLVVALLPLVIALLPLALPPLPLAIALLPLALPLLPLATSLLPK